MTDPSFKAQTRFRRTNRLYPHGGHFPQSGKLKSGTAGVQVAMID